MHVFSRDLHNQPFPDQWVPVLLWVVPLVELLIVLCLLFDCTRRAGFLMATFVMLLFTSYTGLVLVGVFNRVPCSCGGVIRSLSWPQHLVLNTLLTAGAGLGFFYQWRLDHTKHIHR